jgi:hypothetical protein
MSLGDARLHADLGHDGQIVRPLFQGALALD